jgi:hypothetical protein
MKTQDRRTCSSCGNEFSEAIEFCPVCVLRRALADGIESGESSKTRQPVELDRDAMGVTCKAFDGEWVQMAVAGKLKIAK